MGGPLVTELSMLFPQVSLRSSVIGTLKHWKAGFNTRQTLAYNFSPSLFTPSASSAFRSSRRILSARLGMLVTHDSSSIRFGVTRLS